MIEIRVNNEPLDLRMSERLQLQIESNIMRSLSDYTSSYSYTYSLPMTERNVQILNLMNVVNGMAPQTDVPLKYHNVTYTEDGMLIFSGLLYIESMDLVKRDFKCNFVFGKNNALTYWSENDVHPSQIMNRMELWERNAVSEQVFDHTTEEGKWYYCDYSDVQSHLPNDPTCPYYKRTLPNPPAGDCYGFYSARANAISDSAICYWVMNSANSEFTTSKSITGLTHNALCTWSLNVNCILEEIQKRFDVKFTFDVVDSIRNRLTYYMTNRLAKKDYAHFTFQLNNTHCNFTNPDFMRNGSTYETINYFPVFGSIRNCWLESFNNKAYFLDYREGENLPQYATAKNWGGFVYSPPIAFFYNQINLMSIKITWKRVKAKDYTKPIRIYYLPHFKDVSEDAGGHWQKVTPDDSDEIWKYPQDAFVLKDLPSTTTAINYTLNFRNTTLNEKDYKNINFLPWIRIQNLSGPDCDWTEGLKVDYEFYFNGETQKITVPQMYYKRGDYIKQMIPSQNSDGNGGSMDNGYYNIYDSLPNDVSIMDWLSDMMFCLHGAFPISRNLQTTKEIVWMSLDTLYAQEYEDWSSYIMEGTENIEYSLDEVGGMFERFKHCYFTHNNDVVKNRFNIYNTNLVKRIDIDNDLLKYSGDTFQSEIFEYHYPEFFNVKKVQSSFPVCADRLVTTSYERKTNWSNGSVSRWGDGPVNEPYMPIDGCDFLNDLSPETYPVFYNVIQHPMILKATFALPITVLKTLDMTHPVFLRQFGSKFAIVSSHLTRMNDEYYQGEFTLLRLQKPQKGN